MSRKHELYLLVSFLSFILFACKKETVEQIPTSPRLGTTWTYIYKTFDGGGTILTTSTVKYKATSELTLAGEKWLKITDSVNNTLFILRQKADGLYQFLNDTARLLCKFPATVNDEYTSFNNGSPENFKVTNVNMDLYVPKGNIVVNRYEGMKDGHMEDIFWYNKDIWLAKMEKYAANIIVTTYHRDKRWELSAIDY